MYLSVNIDNKVTSIRRIDSFLFLLKQTTNFFLFDFFKKWMYNRFDEMSLINEGMYNHVAEMSATETSIFLNVILKSIKSLDDLDNKMVEINYFEDAVIKQKYKYMLKTFYKLDALLTNKNRKEKNNNQQTPDYLKTQLADYSTSSIVTQIN